MKHRTFRKDLRAIEGFMTEVPALAIITFAVTAFMISAVAASTIYLEDRARAEALGDARGISDAVASYPPILADGRANRFSVDGLDALVAGDLVLELKNTGDMRVTIAESQGGNGSKWAFGTSDRVDDPRATVTTTVLIGHKTSTGDWVFNVGSMEVRAW
jgi:hypothetical protein